MQELEKDMAAKRVVWLIVNSVNPNNASHRTPEQAKQEIADKKIVATTWIDDSSGAVGHLYDMKTTPDMYVIDKNGVLVYQGAIDDKPDPQHDPRTAHNYVRETVNSLLAGKSVEVSQTKPYGCSVKYAD
jgi:hypothetical protein